MNNLRTKNQLFRTHPRARSQREMSCCPPLKISADRNKANQNLSGDSQIMTQGFMRELNDVEIRKNVHIVMIVYTINKYFILYKWKPLVFLAYRKKVELDFTFF